MPQLPQPPEPAAGSGRPGSIWELKPRWCQPWSILLSGVLLITATFLWPSAWWPPRPWLSAAVAAAVIGWWFLFLVLVPAAWRAALEEGDPAGDGVDQR